MRLSISCAALALVCIEAIALTPAGHAQSVTIGGPGDPNNGNQYPFGTEIAEYQQVYAASNFTGPIGINGIGFFNMNFIAGTIDTANYQIELSTTSAAVNGLSNTFASNLGADNTTVFNGTLSGSASPSFDITTSLFNYNPADGNLLLTILDTGGTGSATVFLDADNGDAGGIFSRKYSVSSTTTADNTGFDSNFGLVTEINYQSTPNGTPEPGSLALLTCLAVSSSVCAIRRIRRNKN